MEFQTQFISHEDRRIARQALTGKHGFRSLVKIGDNDVEASLSDFSSLGFAISLEENKATDFSVGQSISIEISPLINKQYQLRGVVIDRQPVRSGYVKISAVIEHSKECGHKGLEPVHLTPEQSLKGQITHPFLYKQTSYFELESLSKNGFYATNINSDFTLFEGMEVSFSLGSISGLQGTKGKISNLSLTAENKIRCFIELETLSKSAAKDLAKHCFHFAQKTPRTINQSGLNSESIQELVQYRFVETQAEYEAVLKLRRKSYAMRNMCGKDDPISKFALEQDAFGRILIVFHNARVIGTALLVFGGREQQDFEYYRHVAADERNKLPNPESQMEITAIFIERHYQETDVIHGIFESMYREGLTAGKDYVVSACEPMWRDRFFTMGFEPTSIAYVHPRNRGIDMQIMMLEKRTGTTGKGMNPINWWKVWGSVSLHLYQRRVIDYTLAEKARVYFNRFLFRAQEVLSRLKQND